MSFLSSLFDPANVFGGNEGGFNLEGVFNPAGGFAREIGANPDWYDNAVQKFGDWQDNIVDFEKDHVKGMWDHFRSNPLGSLVAGTPFSTKVWNKVLNKDWDPQVNQMGGPSDESYKHAEERGIDTGDARGSHQVAGAIAAIIGGGALGAAGGTAGTAAGIGSEAGSALATGAAAGANAWANNQPFWKSALTSGLTNYVGGAVGNYSDGLDNDTWKGIKDTYSDLNNQTGGVLGNTAKGTIGGAMSTGKGKTMGEGAIQGGITGGLGGLFGQGLQGLGMNQAQGDNFGNALARAGMGMYAANQAKKDIGGQIGQLQSLFSGDSPYAQQLQQQLARKDAAAGRRSQYGTRGVELAARLAELNSRNAPQLQNLYNQKSAANMSQYKDLYNVLRSSGLMGQLGDMGKQYFQNYGNYNQGQQQGPLMGYGNFNQGQQAGPPVDYSQPYLDENF